MGLGKIWGGGCAPWPQRRTATAHYYRPHNFCHRPKANMHESTANADVW